VRAGRIPASKDPVEDAMKRDFFVISAAMLAVYVVVSILWGGPDYSSRGHTHQQINADPELKLISEQSPYMRTER
jgi:hypothetical protein